MDVLFEKLLFVIFMCSLHLKHCSLCCDILLSNLMVHYTRRLLFCLTLEVVGCTIFKAGQVIFEHRLSTHCNVYFDA